MRITGECHVCVQGRENFRTPGPEDWEILESPGSRSHYSGHMGVMPIMPIM